MSRWVLGLVLLPLVWGVLHQTGLLFPLMLREGFRSWCFYAAGFLTYILVERLLAKPMWLYVFGHELTHVVTGLLSGAKIHSFKAKSSGGEVRLSKSNAMIALSPYVVPLYAGAVLAVYFVTRHWWNPPYLTPIFQFILGLALAFHISLTISAVHRRQPDLKVLGLFLSSVLIVLGNLLILASLGIGLFSKTPTFSSYLGAVKRDTLHAWRQSAAFSARAGQKSLDWFQTQPWIQ